MNFNKFKKQTSIGLNWKRLLRSVYVPLFLMIRIAYLIMADMKRILKKREIKNYEY